MTVELSPRERAERAVQEEAQALVANGQLVPAVRLLDGFVATHDGDWGLWLYLAGLYARLGLKGPAVAAYRACARQLEDAGLHARARAALQQAAPLDPMDASLARDVQRLTRLLPQDPKDQTCMLEAVQPPGRIPLETVPARGRVTPVCPSPSTTGGARAVLDKLGQNGERAGAPAVLDRLGQNGEQGRVPRPSPSIDLRPRKGPDPFSLLADAPIVFRPSAPRVPAKGTSDSKHARTSVVRRRSGEQPTATEPHMAIFDILDAEKAAR